MMANVPVQFLFEVSNNIVSGDDESYINKESEYQSGSRYEQFISSPG